jgi:hypothetical protein
MNVHTVSLLDDLQGSIGGWHLGVQLSVLALEGIDAHDGLGMREECVCLEESKGKPILPHYQF